MTKTKGTLYDSAHSLSASTRYHEIEEEKGGFGTLRLYDRKL
jgi:hypothetical protein